MTQTPENAALRADALFDFFGSSVTLTETGAPSAAGKAFRSFISGCRGEEISSTDDLSAAIRNWLIRLQIDGTAYTTAVRYLKAISGLYTKAVKEGIAPHADLFRQLMAALRDNGETLWSRNVSAADFNRFTDHVKRAFHDPAKISVASDIAIFSLLNGCMPMAEVARLKADVPVGAGSEAAEIARRNRSSKTKYLFTLNRGNQTPRQLAATLDRALTGVFDKAGIAVAGPPEAALRSYWAYAALISGAAPGAVVAYLGEVPPAMMILSLSDRLPLTDAARQSLVADTAAVFVSNPMRWYAMHLRPRVTYEDLTARLEQTGRRTTRPELFYPSREIARRVGKKKIFENRPLIRDIVYFRTRATAVLPLFIRIGDMAWCYKNGGREGTSYAVISEASFRQFQETIGCFTPEYADYLDTLELLGEGDEIVVTGGLLNGLSGKLRKVISDTPDGIARYLVEVWKDLDSLRIKGTLDSRQVRKKSATPPLG